MVFQQNPFQLCIDSRILIAVIEISCIVERCSAALQLFATQWSQPMIGY